MITISKKILHTSLHQVKLYKQGMFWVAYQQSAYYIWQQKGYLPIKNCLKSVALKVVQTGFPSFVTANTGNLPQRVTSTKLSFVPSTGALTANSFSGSGAGSTGAVASTNANLTGMITSVENIAALGSFTFSNMATALTDETGTGSVVLAASPVFRVHQRCHRLQVAIVRCKLPIPNL